MNHNSSKMSAFVKGMGAGMIAAAAVTVAGKIALSNNKGIAKGSGKMMRAVGDFVDGVQTMIR